jgi:hypothetical protein
MHAVGDSPLKVFGAAEHNLREVDVTFGPGLTAVVDRQRGTGQFHPLQRDPRRY